MKRSFVRIMSGLLVIAMLMALPVVSMADSVGTGNTISVTTDGVTTSVKLRCNHTHGTVGDVASTLKLVKEKAATCTEPAYKEYKCDFYDDCGYTVREYTGGMQGHDYSKTEAISGSNDYYVVCGRDGCGVKYLATAYDGVNFHKHDGSDPVANAALVESKKTAGCDGQVYGYTKVTCSREGCAYVQYKDFVAPYKHTYGAWKWQKRPTENSYGVAYHECADCGAVEKVKTFALTVQAKEGRVKTDGIFAYDAAYDGNKILYLAKGVSFYVADEITEGRYHATELKAPDGSTKTGSFYIDARDVDVFRRDITNTYKTGNPNVQKYVEIKTDVQMDVYSGKDTTSAPIQTLRSGSPIYVYRVDMGTANPGNQFAWGRISRTENKWIQLSGNDDKYLYKLDAFGFGEPAARLEDVQLGTKLDSGTVTAKTLTVYNSPSTDSAYVGTVDKNDVIDFYYRIVDGKQVSPFEVKGDTAWGYIETRGGRNSSLKKLSTSGYINLAQIKLKSTPNPTPTPKPTAPTTGGVIATGSVTSAIPLNVRKDPEVSILNKIGSLPTGTKLEFYEFRNGNTWGRIKYNGQDGWVCMTYVQITSGNTTAIGAGNSQAKLNGTVSNCSVGVNVRDTKDARGKLLGTIPVNSRVAVTKLENGWGFVDGRGWVYMQYVRLDPGAEEAILNPPKDTDKKDETTNGAIKTYTNVKALGEAIAPEGTGVYKNAVKNEDEKLLILVPGNTFVITDRTIVNEVIWYKTTIGSVTGWVKGATTTASNPIPSNPSDKVKLPALSGTVSAGTLNVYSGPSLDGTVVDTLIQNAPVTIEENQQTTDGVYVWGKLKNYNGWVQMNNLSLNVPSSNVITGTSVGTKNITGVTNAADVPVYSVANGGASKVILRLVKNRKLSISAWYMHNDTLRGKFTDGDVTGWIDMAYLDQDALTAKVVVDVVNFYTDNSDAPGTLVSNLNLRLNAATTVIKRTLKDGVAWGKVSARNSAGLPTYYWINLAGTDLGSYSLTPGKPADTTNNNNTNNSNNSNTGSNTNTGTAATTVSGVICNTDTVNVRTAAGVGNPLATTLQRGTPVTVTEQTTVDGALWGHIQQGWVALQYVDLSAKSNTTTSNVTGGNMAGNSILTSVPSGAIAVGFVNTDSLKVRAGTGFGYAVQATLPKYTNVVVYEQVLTDGVLWVRCDQGWMVGTYLTYTGLSVTGSGTAGTVARCFYTARVRSQPGVNSPLVGYVMVNSRLEIYEQQSYSGEMWGRTSIGWISMNYVLTGDVPVA